jgi:hypothetical protein
MGGGSWEEVLILHRLSGRLFCASREARNALSFVGITVDTRTVSMRTKGFEVMHKGPPCTGYDSQAGTRFRWP